MPRFIKGLDLNREFYFEVVEPLMREEFPDLQYSAGLIGHGSDVLGFDSPTSKDHDWGPHLSLVFSDVDFVTYRDPVDQMLRNRLPPSYKGFPTNFVEGDRYRKHIPRLKKRGPMDHLFGFWTIRSYFQHYLGFDIDRKPTYQDWLLFPQQALIEITAGQLFRDDLDFEEVRSRFHYYPDDIWRYMLRVQWGKILDELQMQARSAKENDALGAQVITARTVQKMMFLNFLMEKRYAPYSKWFGVAFREWLRAGSTMIPIYTGILNEKNWRKRQRRLANAYVKLGEMHNRLGITKPLSTKIVDFYGRGIPIIDMWQYVDELERSIRNEKLRTMRFPLGGIDQFIDHARINHMDYVYNELQDIIQ
ncbi:MAG: DUF4037 domain-containing protein [Bacillota bacterium]